MPTIYEYGKKMLWLCKANQYYDAVKLFEDKISKEFPEQMVFRSFLVMWSIPEAYCKIKRWDKGISLALHYIEPLTKLKVKVNNILENYGFLIYKALWPKPPLVKPESIDPAAMYLLLTMLKNSQGKYNIDKKLYILWIKLIPTVESIDFETGQQFYLLYQPDELAGNAQDNPTEQDFTPVDLWYLKHTKFLYIHKQYQQCCQLCEQALDSKELLTINCQVWITRRCALALKQMGDINKATTLMEVLAKRKLEWYIFHELGELYFEKGDKANGEKCLVMAYRLGSHNPSKVNLYERLGDFCQEKYLSDIAHEFYTLALCVRLEQNWKIPESLKSKVNTNTKPFDSAQLYRNILRFFQPTIEVNDMLFGVGEITRILHPGDNGDGFITDTEGNTVYFRFAQANFSADEVDDEFSVKFKAKLTIHKGKKRWRATKVYRAI